MKRQTQGAKENLTSEPSKACMTIDLNLTAPKEFLKLAKHFGFTAQFLAYVVLADFCADAPDSLLLTSDEPLDAFRCRA
jgi:hypothetical protein